jgi:hypothetical protein
MPHIRASSSVPDWRCCLWRCPGRQPTARSRRRAVWLSFSPEFPFSSRSKEERKAVSGSELWNGKHPSGAGVRRGHTALRISVGLQGGERVATGEAIFERPIERVFQAPLDPPALHFGSVTLGLGFTAIAVLDGLYREILFHTEASCRPFLAAYLVPSASPTGSASVICPFRIARRFAQPCQREPRITLQKLPRWKCGSLSASTSALTLPNVVSGLCLMPS